MRLMPSCGGQLLHVLLLQLVAVGCGPGVREPSVQVVRMGPQVPPKSSDCSVLTLTIDVQQVGLAFESHSQAGQGLAGCSAISQHLA